MEQIEVHLNDNKKSIFDSLIELIKSIIIPLTIGFSTYYYTMEINKNNVRVQKNINENNIKIKFIEIATTILSDKPTEENQDLRKWATDILNANSNIKLNTKVINSLIQNTPIGFNSYFLQSNEYNFRWEPIENAIGYDLEIQQSDDNKNWLYFGGKCLTGNQITTFILINAKHIRWRVTASGQKVKNNWKHIK